MIYYWIKAEIVALVLSAKVAGIVGGISALDSSPSVWWRNALIAYLVGIGVVNSGGILWFGAKYADGDFK